jgi:hypoxanthine phosphoribosyltransferase
VHQDLERILLREADIEQGIERLAGELTYAYAGKRLTVVAVLKGSFLFAADLVRRLPLPLELGFAVARSYADGTTPRHLAVDLVPAESDLAGRDVLLVDDILDSGRTLQHLARELRARGAREVKTCVLLDKPARRAVDLRADWSCFTIEDVFVVGYGLDFAGRYRNLPCIAALKREVLERQPAAEERA